MCRTLRRAGVRRVLDLGCGAGDLALPLVQEAQIARVVALDVDRAALARLQRAATRLPAENRAKLQLVAASMLDPPGWLSGMEAAVMLESFEHLPPERLSLWEGAILRRLRPQLLLLTTPNADFNPLLGVPAGRRRHRDHRFEWGRARFRTWAAGAARRNGYEVACHDMAGAHPDLGGASQMAVFRLAHTGP